MYTKGDGRGAMGFGLLRRTKPLTQCGLKGLAIKVGTLLVAPAHYPGWNPNCPGLAWLPAHFGFWIEAKAKVRPHGRAVLRRSILGG